MQALVFDVRPLRYAVARLWGERFPAAAAANLSLCQREEPPLPGPEWARLEVLYAGFCGSDLAALLGKASPALAAVSSFPAVLGHEIVARVIETGRGIPDLSPGQRVVVNPFLGCRIREVPEPCRPCREGWSVLCEKADEGRFSPGLLLGFCRDLPGGWGHRIVAHRSQLFPVPDAVPDRLAALAEPLAIGLHAVRRADPRPGERALVLGGGAIAYATLMGLKQLSPDTRTLLWSLFGYQRDLALLLGADRAAASRDGAVWEREVTDFTGAKRLPGRFGGSLWTGGFDLSFDCVGSEDTLRRCLAATRAGGRVILVGCATVLRRLDLTPLWSKELDVRGAVGYGPERLSDGRRHTLELALDLLAEEPEKASRLITHVYPLGKYREAIEANISRDRYRSVKTLFQPV